MGMDYPKMTAYGLLAQTAQKYPKAAAYYFMGAKTTYARLMERISRVASGLYELGIRKGDRVTVCMPNMPQAVDCFYGLNRLGAVANMVHPLCAPEELRFSLSLTDSKAILTLDSFYEKVAAVADDRIILTASVKPELPFWKKRFYRETTGQGGLCWQRLYCSSVALPPAETDHAACACILYSGGTTGKPKGVCLSNDNINAAALQTVQASGYDHLAGMKMLAVMPIFHGFGLGVGIHTPLVAGASAILMPRFTQKSFIEILKKQKPDFIPGVPALFASMLQAEELQNADLSYIKGMFCGGDILPPSLKEKVDAFLLAHGCREQLREGYGMTESVSVSALTPRHAFKTGTIGLPLADMQFTIVQPGTTQSVGTGQVGEICISGPTVMLGYLQDPEETALALQRHDDGRVWLHTGDLGSMDAAGYLQFHQRLKRMIVTNGYNVYPTQLEQAMLLHPAVAECCVLGAPDEKRGQMVKAFVVARGDVTQTQLLEHCSRYVARYAMPKQIVFCPQIPKTSLGKVDYKQLEAL